LIIDCVHQHTISPRERGWSVYQVDTLLQVTNGQRTSGRPSLDPMDIVFVSLVYGQEVVMIFFLSFCFISMLRSINYEILSVWGCGCVFSFGRHGPGGRPW